MTRPTASVSLDLDNIWSYLRTHGDPEWASRPSYLDVATPRIVDFFGENDQVATVFVIGADAVRDDGAAAVEQFVRAGHEIGNHSFEHEPWLHRYSAARLEQEIVATEDAIVAAGAPRPVGFRGPGFSVTRELLELLAARGYTYDASTLPTWIGPLARAYHNRSAQLTPEQVAERGALFGGPGECLRPITPYRWTGAAEDLVELPVTTMPLARVPIHGSYLVQLYSSSPRLARGYFRTALRLCVARGVGMSMLVHPTDLLDARDAPQLAFFPGMSVPAAEKSRFMSWALEQMRRRFDVVGTGEHARRTTPNRTRPIETARRQ